MDKLEYSFKKPGATVGAETGSRLTWQPGDTRVLPKGELTHVNDAHYETRPLKPSPDQSANATSAAEDLAVKNGIDLAEVEGSGKDGRVLKADVEALI